jgi:hypothetical protein
MYSLSIFYLLSDWHFIAMFGRFSCQSAVLEIMANELFLEERILQGEKSEKTSDQSIKNVLRKFFDSHDPEELVKHYTASGYDIDLLHRAKVTEFLH